MSQKFGYYEGPLRGEPPTTVGAFQKATTIPHVQQQQRPQEDPYAHVRMRQQQEQQKQM